MMAFYVALDRFEHEIREYEQYPVETGRVLLYGSSFFHNWGFERAAAQWSEATNGALQIVNHGFGGATVDDLLFYYHRMVRIYAPSAVVLRLGYNDLSRGLMPAEAWFLSERLIAWLRTDFPEIPIVLLDVFDSKNCTEERLRINAAFNGLMHEFAAQQDGICTLDLSPFFHETADDCGTTRNFRDVFIEDGLHLTESGYAEMADYLAPRVAALLRGI